MPAYTCPKCGSTNDIGVVGPGPHVQVQCPACSWWFEPRTYVTEEKPPLSVATTATINVDNARKRLVDKILKYPEYAARDSDILVVAIFDHLRNS